MLSIGAAATAVIAAVVWTAVSGSGPPQETPQVIPPTHPGIGSNGAILFTSNRAGLDSLYVVNADGTGLRRLVADARNGLWSPDGSAVAFVHRDKSRAFAVVSPLGETPKQLAPEVVYAIDGPFAWSPDGRRIAYSTYAGLVIANAHGRRQRTIDTGDLSVRNLDWSPNGRTIALDSYHDVHAVEVDGGKLRTLVRDATRPRWSPNGSRILFVRQTVDFDEHLWVAASDGSEPRKLTRKPVDDPNSLSASWSPDGTTIAFSGGVFLERLGDGETFVVEPDGSGLRRVGGGERPSWSPDGTQLALVREGRIWVVAVDGGEGNSVSAGSLQAEFGNWAPNWHPRGIRTEDLGGSAVSRVPPAEAIVAGSVLRSPAQVVALAADGSRVAVWYERDKSGVQLWRAPGKDVTTPSGKGIDSSTLLEVALAGTRAAWLTYEQGNHFYEWLEVASPGSAPNTVVQLATDGQLPCAEGYCDTIGDLRGDGSLLVYDSWEQKSGRTCEWVDCFREDKAKGVLWRIIGKRAVKIRSERVGLTALSVDRGLIAVQRSDGPLELVRTSGQVVRTFAFARGEVRAAALSGQQLVVQRKRDLSIYDIGTGRLQHTWPLPTQGRLADAESGIAVFVVRRTVHLLRLANGRDVTIRVPGQGWVDAQIEKPGLFYSYTAPEKERPGRVVFVPARDLLGLLAR